MKLSLAILKRSFQLAKYKIDKRELYHKVKLVKQMREEEETTLDILTEDCIDHVLTYLLPQETMNGPEPRYRRSTSVTIKEDNKPLIFDKREWLLFRLYVAKHKNWIAYSSFDSPKTTYHVFYEEPE